MSKDFENAPDLKDAMNKADERPARPKLELDAEKYQRYIDDPSLSRAEKEQVLEALWSIIIAFVDLGFDVGPASESCGKDAKVLESTEETDSNRTSLKKTELKQAFADEPEQ
ncbi:MAG: hypothetical protein AAFR17_08625 [Pseudomonadota bacterium]